MRKNFGAKPYTYPQPVFMIATYDENGTPDVMNAAWGGISEGNELSMEFVDAPLIEELAVAVECRLKSYDAKTCRLVGEIVNVSVDEKVLDENGNVDIAKAQPITFDPFNNKYVVLGDVVGNAFTDGKKLM